MSGLGRWLAPAFALALVAGPASVLAQGGGGVVGECVAPDPTTAEVNAREGVRLAKAKQFDAAIALFRVASSLDPCAAEYLLLLARALARRDQIEEARSYYQQVVDRFPGTRESERAGREIDDLYKNKKKGPDPTPIVKNGGEHPVGGIGTTAPPRGDQPPWKTIGYATAGAGLAFFAGGIFYALDAQSADSDIQSAIDNRNEDKYDQLVDDRDASTTLSYVFYGAAGVLLAAGAVMVFVLPRDSGGTGTVSVAPDPAGAHLFYRLEF